MKKQLLSLGEAVRLVAKLGGYLGRANDPPPGHQLMWEGYFILQIMGEGFALAIDQHCPVSDKGKGQG